MAIAPRGDAFLVSPCELRRLGVVPARQVGVQCLQGREPRGEPFIIIGLAPSRQAGKDVLRGKEETLLPKIIEQAREIIAPALDFGVLRFADVIDRHVRLGAAGHPARDFLAEEEIGIPPQLLTSVDRIVVGKGDQTHPQRFQLFVDCGGGTVRFVGEAAQQWEAKRSGVAAMHVKVTSHVTVSDGILTVI